LAFWNKKTKAKIAALQDETVLPKTTLEEYEGISEFLKDSKERRYLLRQQSVSDNYSEETVTFLAWPVAPGVVFFLPHFFRQKKS